MGSISPHNPQQMGIPPALQQWMKKSQFTPEQCKIIETAYHEIAESYSLHDNPHAFIDVFRDRTIIHARTAGWDELSLSHLAEHIDFNLRPGLVNSVAHQPSIGITSHKQLKDAENFIKTYVQNNKALLDHHPVAKVNQKQAVLEAFSQASKNPNPVQAFHTEIRQLQHQGYWGEEKANVILKDCEGKLRAILSSQSSVNPAVSDQAPFRQKPAPVSRPVHAAPTRQLSSVPMPDYRKDAPAVAHIAKTQKCVCFYKTGPTQALGNFAPCPNGIKVFNQTFLCAEAAFQYRKYQLAGATNAELAGFLPPCDGEKAYDVSKDLRTKYQVGPNWDSKERNEAMWAVLQNKFQQNPELKDILQTTQGAFLLEHRDPKSKDDYWSDGWNGRDAPGNNMLGKMLASVRDGGPMPPAEVTKDPNLPGKARIKKEAAQFHQRPPGYGIY